MQAILQDLLTFFQSLNLNDIIFFSAIMSLIILVISMIYFLRVNKEEETSIEVDEFSQELLKEVGGTPDNEEDTIPKTRPLPKAEDEPDTLIDLDTITKNLENQEINADLTKYEEEQEEKAIISYDELLQHTDQLKINYLDETTHDGVSIKQVDMEHMTVAEDKVDTKTPEITLISYDKEEAFLKTLKDLEKILG